MTIMEAIHKIDDLKPNTYSEPQKVAWLSQADHRIKLGILDAHEGGEGVSFAGYDENTPMETELLVKAPFDVLYLRWLEAQIDYYNSEIKRYNISISLFNTEYEAFEKDYRRTHMPKSRGRFIF